MGVNMSDDQIETHERLACVETKVDAIMNNHLPHIQDKINKVDGRTWWILGTVILGFLTTIAIMLLKEHYGG